jgi:hypothetical protein
MSLVSPVLHIGIVIFEGVRGLCNFNTSFLIWLTFHERGRERVCVRACESESERESERVREGGVKGKEVGKKVNMHA